jgi:hypothetical protein
LLLGLSATAFPAIGVSCGDDETHEDDDSYEATAVYGSGPISSSDSSSSTATTGSGGNGGQGADGGASGVGGVGGAGGAR